MTESPVRALLNPRGVAIIGASDDPLRIGGRPLHYLRESAFAGPLYVVNPSRTKVQGLPSYPKVADLPTAPDVAIIAVGRDRAARAIRDCGERGIPSAIVFAAGYAETGDEGRRAQEELLKAARAGGVRLLGPNANGLINPRARAPLAFTPILADGLPPAGSLCIATQSAAVGTYWLRRLRTRSMGLHSWIHTGNEADLCLADFIDGLMDDPSAGPIIVVLEQWRHPERLDSLLARLRARRAAKLIVLPLGTTPVGRAAAVSHTGSLTGRQTEMVIGQLRQAGALVGRGLEECLDLAAAIDAGKQQIGDRVGILTTSGGLGILLADAWTAAGFRIPELSDNLQREFRDLVPFCSPRNPVDITAQGVNDPGVYRSFLERLIVSREVDLLSLFLPHGHGGDPLTLALLDVSDIAAKHSVQLLAVGDIPPQTASTLQARGILSFTEPTIAAEVLRTLRQAVRPPVANPPPLRSPASRPLAPPASGALSDELAVKTALAEHGVPVVPDRVAGDGKTAALHADDLGYPVVVKIHQTGLAHKARVGGVRTGLRQREAVIAAAHAMAPLLTPGSHLLVEPHLSGDELFVAVSRDSSWGPLALLGVGGGNVEERAEVAFRRLPVDEFEVRSMVDELEGLRGLFEAGERRRAYSALADMFAVLHRLLAPDVQVIELNPVMLSSVGEITVVDALAEWRGRARSIG